MIEGIWADTKPPPTDGSEGINKARRTAREDGPTFGEVLKSKKKSSTALEEETAGALMAASTAKTPEPVPVVEDSSRQSGEEDTNSVGAAGATGPEGPEDCQADGAAVSAGAEEAQACAANAATAAAAASAAGTAAGDPANGETAAAAIAADASSAGAAASATAVEGADEAIANAPSGAAAAASVGVESTSEVFANMLSAAAPTDSAEMPLQTASSNSAVGAEMAAGLKTESAIPTSNASAAAAQTLEASTQSEVFEREPAAQSSSTSVEPVSGQRAELAAAAGQQTAQAAATGEPARTTEAPIDLMQQIAKNAELMASQNQTSLRVRLNPAELGSIDIRLVSNQNGVAIVVLAEQAATSKLLEANMGRLQQTMTDAGVQVSNLFVGQNGQQDLRDSRSTRQENMGARELSQFESKKAIPMQALPEKASRRSLIDYRV